MTGEDLRNDKLTSIEKRGLQSAWNLCDAHTHQRPNSAELENIVYKLPEIFTRAGNIEQRVTDSEVYDAFHNLCGQVPPTRPSASLICYSSSQALEITGNLFRNNGISRIALYEPTFDSIPDILHRHGATLIPLRLADDWQSDLQRLVIAEAVQVVFVVVPNNPTGELLSEHELREIANLTARHGIILVVDSSFRIMDFRACFDFYSILEESGTSYVVIEDSGKIWPALDQKVAFLNSSADLSNHLYLIHQDQLLNVSPFTNLIVAQFCKQSMTDLLESVRGLIQANRELVKQKIYANGLARPRNPDSRVSVEFMDMKPGYSAVEFADYVREAYDLWVLPGDRFYWSGDVQSDSALRLALSRDTNYFAEALEILSKGIEHFYKR